MHDRACQPHMVVMSMCLLCVCSCVPKPVFTVNTHLLPLPKLHEWLV